LYEKEENQTLRQFRDRPQMLLARHSVMKSETSALLYRVIVLKSELQMLPQFSYLAAQCSGTHAVEKFNSENAE
jgi:hypothetical protein